jgi:small subunit ribosomal protein S20
MPIIKSAKKRVKTTKKATVRNARTKRNVREAVKAFKTAVSKGKSDKIIEAQNQANSAIDTAAKKNVIHKNKAARKKAQLAKEAKAANVKLHKSAKVKSTTKKQSTPKNSAVKKSPSRKTTVKKIKK